MEIRLKNSEIYRYHNSERGTSSNALWLSAFSLALREMKDGYSGKFLRREFPTSSSLSHNWKIIINRAVLLFTSELKVKCSTLSSQCFFPVQWRCNSPVIVRKFGPPLLAGESASCGGHFASIVFPFTHNALPYIDCIKKAISGYSIDGKQWSLWYHRCESYPSSHKDHSSRFSSLLHWCHHPPRADVYRWQLDESHSWKL